MTRATRLAFTSERAVLRRAGNEQARPGWRARRAWRILERAGDAGDQNAIEAVWQAWLGSLDDVRWDLLTRWRGPAETAGAVFAVAVEPGRPAPARADLGAFCTRHGLAPDDRVPRSSFFVLTGQPEQRRALDPDGALLAAAYRAADPATRAALREALSGAGDLDLVRVVAGEQRAAVTTDEVGYLTAHLVGRRDWAGLWRLVLGLPCTDAAAAMRWFGGGWRPAGDRDGELFDVLLRADPKQLGSARHALKTRAESAAATIAAPGPGTAALSADGRRLAVITPRDHSGAGAGAVLSVFDISAADETAGQARPETYPVVGSPDGIELAFAGDTPIVYRWRGRVDPPGTAALHTRRRTKSLAALYRMRPDELAPTPDGGIVALTPARLRFCDHDGARIATMRLPHLGELQCVTAGPSGRLGVGGRDAFAVVDATDPRRPRLVASAQTGLEPEIAFCSPDRILTIADFDNHESATCSLGLWRLDGERLELMTARRTMPYLWDPVVIPWHGTLAFISVGPVRYLDALSLADVSAPRGFATEGQYGLWNSADLGTVALLRSETIYVHTAVTVAIAVAAEVANRRPAEWTPADLRAVTAAQAATQTGSVTRPLLDLLRAGLEHRFGSEVAIADEASGASGASGASTASAAQDPDGIAIFAE